MIKYGQTLAKTQHLSGDRLQIVFKVVERCNINCTYCYYFNMGDSSAFQRPSVVDVDSAERLASWLAVGCRELQTKELLISFHGGEPMMLNPEKFETICRLFVDRLGQIVDVYFNIQTNGTKLTDKWLSTLCKHRVNVGVSIDGGRIAHDRYRLDRQGRSTFDRTEKNLRTLIRAAKSVPSSDLTPSTISVLDYHNDYVDIYNYLRQLGVRRMSFLLPDRSFDDGFSGDEGAARKYGESLFQIFKAWMTEDDPGVEIRVISEFLQNFQCQNLPLREEGVPKRLHEQPESELSSSKKLARRVLIAHSDGCVSVSDSYIPALSWYRTTPQCSIQDTSLRDFLMNGIFDEIERATMSLPTMCQECRWKRICRGGDLENRYSKKKGFDNPSVYCDGYKWFYQRACELLVDNGYPVNLIEKIVASDTPSTLAELKVVADLPDGRERPGGQLNRSSPLPGI